MLTFADLVEALCGVRPRSDIRLVQAVFDSRLAGPGALFIALPGENVDGHDYVVDAFERGATCALVQRPVETCGSILDLKRSWDAAGLQQAVDALGVEKPICLEVADTLAALQQAARFWRSKHDLYVVGITGSVGKSTTKELTAQVLNRHYLTLKNEGNFNNEIGLPLTLLGLNADHRAAVLEMGFYVPGEISLLCEIARPQIGVITNIGTVHAERAGSQEAIARGKAELVQSLPAAPLGTAILNYDDPWVREMAGQTRARVFTYGLEPYADLWADRVEGLGLDGIRFRLHYRREALQIKAPLIGRHSVHTALRAAAVGLALNLSWEEIIGGLRSEHTQLRLMTVRGQNGALILDDTYNAAPESTLAALNLLAELSGYKIAVLGDMLELGPYERSGHQRVGLRAAEVVDELIAVGPRAGFIAEAALAAGLTRQKISHFLDVEAVIQHLQGRLRANDVVLVKASRGMHLDRVVSALERRV